MTHLVLAAWSFLIRSYSDESDSILDHRTDFLDSIVRSKFLLRFHWNLRLVRWQRVLNVGLNWKKKSELSSSQLEKLWHFNAYKRPMFTHHFHGMQAKAFSRTNEFKFCLVEFKYTNIQSEFWGDFESISRSLVRLCVVWFDRNLSKFSHSQAIDPNSYLVQNHQLWMFFLYENQK